MAVPHSGQQSEHQAAHVTPPVWGEGKIGGREQAWQGLASFLRALILYSDGPIVGEFAIAVRDLAA